MLTFGSLFVILIVLTCCLAHADDMGDIPAGSNNELGSKINVEIGMIHSGFFKFDQHNEVDKSERSQFGFSQMPLLLRDQKALLQNLRDIDVVAGDDYAAAISGVVGDAEPGLKVIPAPYEHVLINGLWVSTPRALYIVTDNSDSPVDFGRVWKGVAGSPEKNHFLTYLLISVF